MGREEPDCPVAGKRPLTRNAVIHARDYLSIASVDGAAMTFWIEGRAIALDQWARRCGLRLLCIAGFPDQLGDLKRCDRRCQDHKPGVAAEPLKVGSPGENHVSLVIERDKPLSYSLSQCRDFSQSGILARSARGSRNTAANPFSLAIVIRWTMVRINFCGVLRSRALEFVGKASE